MDFANEANKKVNDLKLCCVVTILFKAFLLLKIEQKFPNKLPSKI